MIMLRPHIAHAVEDYLKKWESMFFHMCKESRHEPNEHMWDMLGLRVKNNYDRDQNRYKSVPQGSVLGPIPYTIYTADFPPSNKVLVTTFADDTAILASHEEPSTAAENLENELKDTEYWLTKGEYKRVKTNQFMLLSEPELRTILL
ncbi:hypothetical protein ANN_12542 [Periplaneta americana]|uniref:Reverse transcriptase domain-containing protein n=1 Tax=Periplaneta americana TaxID=6978 RepID=A0ABQ8THH0_PERAM|nr:hypothetical protein ANN_12542 [Periplaneta americana]